MRADLHAATRSRLCAGLGRCALLLGVSSIPFVMMAASGDGAGIACIGGAVLGGCASLLVLLFVGAALVYGSRMVGCAFGVQFISQAAKTELETVKALKQLPVVEWDSTDATGDAAAGEECALCLEVLEGPVTQLPCRHHFHKHCIDRWVQDHDTCPLCRESIDLSGSTSTIMLQLLRMLAQEL